jgi:superfamily II DNA or RNA helicase
MVRSYSSIKDEDFEKNICNKKEFLKYRWESSENRTNTQLLPHQQWLANYINPKTPYKGMLVYHETGTGKTCTAISIAENFKDELIKNKKKIIILCSDNIKEEFYRTISNPDDSFKCTGNTYNDMIESSDITQKNLNQIINQYYNFQTHQKFGKDVDKNTSKEPALIHKKYSNSVIIIDEAQHLRSKFDSKDKKDKGEKLSHDAIDLISKYAENVKIVFLTATPMYDNPMEIIWMINVLIRVNGDNISELNEQDIFNQNDDYSFREEGREQFIRAIKGKVSFLRSGDPESFPLKLQDSKGTNKFPKISFLDKPLNNWDKNIKDANIKLTLSKMSKTHYDIIKNTKINSINSGTKDSFHMQMLQLNNVSWYKKGTDDDDINTGSGLNKHFKITKQGIYTPIEPNVLNNLDEYAPKINTILNHILEMGDNGIAFVFSQFVSSGIVPMILALESKGFSKYDGLNSKFHHLKIPRKKDDIDPGRYIVITSSKILATNRQQELINIARSKGNENGQKIRVIIASGAGGEGLDLKWIRQVHILEPHFHFSQIEQAVGRAIRNNSHIELPVENRNCTIYYHSTEYPKNVDVETVDMHLYRIAMKKRFATQQVRKLIQENSITCNFFKNVNVFDYTRFFGNEIVDSKGNKFKFTNKMVVDEGYSNECLTCIMNDDIDTDTYMPLLHSKWHIFETIRKIDDLFKINDKYSLNDIIQHINTWNNQIDQESIYFALDIIINSPERIIQNQFEVKGVISLIGNYYVFVPEYAEYNGDISGIPLRLSNKSVSLDIVEWPKRPDPNKYYSTDIDITIENSFSKLLEKMNFNQDGFWSNIPDIRNQLIADVLIDKLTSEERKILFFGENKLSNKFLITSLDRYKQNQNFIDITSIDEAYKIVDSKNKIIKTGPTPSNLKSLRRTLFGYLDIIDHSTSLYVMDGRTSSRPKGWRVLSQQKEKIIGFINSLFQIEPGKNIPPLFKYPRYATDISKKGQLLLKTKVIKAPELMIELEILFRYLNTLIGNTDPKLFYNLLDAYDYGIESKKTKPKDDTKKGTIVKTRRKNKNPSNKQTKRKK